MSNPSLNLEDLASAADLNPRAVRFYIQRGLIPGPAGLGRGRHYGQEHLEALRRIRDLQNAGHSLDAIGQILKGREPEPVADMESPAPPPPALSAELWTHLKILRGVELHFDATQHQPDVEQLLALRDAIREIFKKDPVERESSDDEANSGQR